MAMALLRLAYDKANPHHVHEHSLIIRVSSPTSFPRKNFLNLSEFYCSNEYTHPLAVSQSYPVDTCWWYYRPFGHDSTKKSETMKSRLNVSHFIYSPEEALAGMLQRTWIDMPDLADEFLPSCDAYPNLLRCSLSNIVVGVYVAKTSPGPVADQGNVGLSVRSLA